MTAPATAQPKMSPQQLNALQRQAVLGQAVKMTQQIYSTTINPTNSNVLNITPRNVGLVTKFIVEISGTANNTGATTAATLTDFGLANLLSNVTFNDLNNNVRINTTGWHLNFIASARHRKPYASTYSFGVDQSTFGNNFPVTSAASTIAAGANAPFRAVFDVPLAYSDDDLRGAVYANVLSAVMNLQLTLNNAAFTTAGDSTFAVYSGNTGTLNPVTVTIYQEYYDQLPIGQQGVILPMLDLSTVYELKNTLFNSVAANQDFPVAYANFRDFLSTFAIWNNAGTTAGRTNGSDINYWSLQSANFTNIFKIDALLAAQKTREIIGADLPVGCYYFSSRRKPISTTQFGNMELVLNANTAVAGNYLQIGWEDFALVNTLTAAGSLAG